MIDDREANRFTDACISTVLIMITMLVLVLVLMMMMTMMMLKLMLMITCLEAATICLRKNLSLVVMHRMMNILSLIMIFIVMLMMMLIMVIMMVMMLMMMFANPIYTESVCLLSPGGGIRQPVGTHSLADKNIINIIIIIIINIITNIITIIITNIIFNRCPPPMGMWLGSW